MLAEIIGDLATDIDTLALTYAGDAAERYPPATVSAASRGERNLF